jgi:hypothetical protein
LMIIVFIQPVPVQQKWNNLHTLSFWDYWNHSSVRCHYSCEFPSDPGKIHQRLCNIIRFCNYQICLVILLWSCLTGRGDRPASLVIRDKRPCPRTRWALAFTLLRNRKLISLRKQNLQGGASYQKQKEEIYRGDLICYFMKSLWPFC